ncbi:MAG: YaiO family outer membrane beta-barrel protein [Flavobacteriaceae bacterium]
MQFKFVHIVFLLVFWSGTGWAQDMALNSEPSKTYDVAWELAFSGKHDSARDTLNEYLNRFPESTKARSLLARTYSWEGNYDSARKEFNALTSKERQQREVWIAAVKNELYAKNDATALGLANKALGYLKEDKELERLRTIALHNIENKVYEPYSAKDTIQLPLGKISTEKKKIKKSKKPEKIAKEGAEKEEDATPKNTFGLENSFTIFSEVYDANVTSTVNLKRQTKFGAVIPRISYANRFQIHGLQYGISAYPKLAKKMYAYLSYAYSSASIYPNHSVGGDLYASLPGSIEVSGGARYMAFDARDISIITNSLGWYKGNYYFSLRSYITPRANNLTRVSGNLIVRKYLKDAENYLGASAGIGFSPELRQVILDGTVLSETLFYLESQRLSLEYQFTGKNTPNIYKTRLGVSRIELFNAPGSFLFAVSAGLTYRVKF